MIKYYLAAQFPRYLASRLRLVGASGSEQNLSSVTSDTVWEVDIIYILHSNFNDASP